MILSSCIYLSNNERYDVGNSAHLSADIVIQDGKIIKNRFGPITPPEPPAHRVEDETWEYSGGWIRPVQHHPIGITNSALVCKMPSPETDPRAEKLIVARAKRICAGQEALKLLAKLYTPANMGWTGFDAERQRILDSIRD